MEFKLKEAAVCAGREFEMIKIIPEVGVLVEEGRIENGLVYVITEHTTTGTTVNESLDYVEKDTMKCLSRIVSEDYLYYYNHYLPTYGTIGGNTPDHLKSLLIGNHYVSPIVRGELKLGHATDIYFCECDGIRMCHYVIYAVGERKEQNVKRVIAMADNCIDIYYKPDRYYLIGDSIDFMLNYRDLGGDATEMTILDSDVFAMALERRLKEREITPRVLKCVDHPTRVATMGIVDGDKKHLHLEGNAMEEVEPSGEDLEFMKPFDVVYAGRRSGVDRYIKELKQPRQIWTYDFSKRLERGGNDLILSYPDHTFFSYGRGDSCIRGSMVKVRKRGTDTVIVMLGEHGSLACNGDRFYEKGVEKVPMVNTMGVGDSYIVILTCGVSLGESMPRCMDRGKKWTTEIIRQFSPHKQKKAGSEMKDYKVIAVGNSVCDKYLFRDKMYPGGQCINTYVYAKLNGVYTAYLGKYGADQVAEYVRDTLKWIGINDSHSRCHEGENGFALVTLKGNNRVFLGSNKGGVAREYDYDSTKEDSAYINRFNLTYTNLNSYIGDDLKSLREAGAATTCDSSTRWTGTYLEKVCPYVTMTTLFYAHLTRQEWETEMKKVQSYGVKAVPGTTGKDRFYVLHDDNFSYTPAIHANDVIDTMGVGSSYFATLLYSSLETSQVGAVVGGTEERMKERLVEAVEGGATFATKIYVKEGALGYGVSVLGRTEIQEPGAGGIYRT